MNERAEHMPADIASLNRQRQLEADRLQAAGIEPIEQAQTDFAEAMKTRNVADPGGAAVEEALRHMRTAADRSTAEGLTAEQRQRLQLEREIDNEREMIQFDHILPATQLMVIDLQHIVDELSERVAHHPEEHPDEEREWSRIVSWLNKFKQEKWPQIMITTARDEMRARTLFDSFRHDYFTIIRRTGIHPQRISETLEPADSPKAEQPEVQPETVAELSAAIVGLCDRISRAYAALDDPTEHQERLFSMSERLHDEARSAIGSVAKEKPDLGSVREFHLRQQLRTILHDLRQNELLREPPERV